jgi:hypothetical protein
LLAEDSSPSPKFEILTSLLMINFPRGPENDETAFDRLFQPMVSVSGLRLLTLAATVADGEGSALLAELPLSRSNSLLIVVVIWFVSMTLLSR